MSLQRVAQLAGVSTSTVSRVVRDHPSVSSGTATAVRDAIRRLSFTPVTRMPRASRDGAGERAVTSLGLVVLGTSGANAAPAFEKLLRGVSSACNDRGLSLTIGFITDAADVPNWILGRTVDGLLLHGEQPVSVLQDRLRSLPSVWLMANRRRPRWGDQGRPHNAGTGHAAAK